MITLKKYNELKELQDDEVVLHNLILAKLLLRVSSGATTYYTDLNVTQFRNREIVAKAMKELNDGGFVAELKHGGEVLRMFPGQESYDAYTNPPDLVAEDTPLRAANTNATITFDGGPLRARRTTTARTTITGTVRNETQAGRIRGRR